jgi:hypothetical protein
MEDEIEQKQEYLRTQILEQNYEAEDFLQYIQNIKGENAADLNLWNFEELKSAVENYKDLHSPNKKQSRKRLKSEEERILETTTMMLK